jgi:hypothetical protein
MALLKFACISAEFAPKRKFVNFAKPKFYKKLGEFTDVDMHSWVNNLYQDKVFETAKKFNEAYDQYIASGMTTGDVLFWRSKPMILSKDDVAALEAEEFETPLTKLFERIRKAQSEAKVVFVYA